MLTCFLHTSPSNVSEEQEFDRTPEPHHHTDSETKDESAYQHQNVAGKTFHNKGGAIGRGSYRKGPNHRRKPNTQ